MRTIYILGKLGKVVLKRIICWKQNYENFLCDEFSWNATNIVCQLWDFFIIFNHVYTKKVKQWKREKLIIYKSFALSIYSFFSFLSQTIWLLIVRKSLISLSLSLSFSPNQFLLHNGKIINVMIHGYMIKKQMSDRKIDLLTHTNDV